jgi:alkylation response protein AidB-like acyl-CoA dehydrogenase
VTDSFAALCVNEPELAALRGALREFLVADLAEFGWQPRVDAWLSSWDEPFSARLGAAGFLGLTIPTEYGGRGLGPPGDALRVRLSPACTAVRLACPHRQPTPFCFPLIHHAHPPRHPARRAH